MSDPLGGLFGWGQGQKSAVSEYGHVVYQIKRNEMYHNIFANILISHTPLTPSMESRGQHSFFPEGGRVAYQVKQDEA